METVVVAHVAILHQNRKDEEWVAGMVGQRHFDSKAIRTSESGELEAPQGKSPLEIRSLPTVFFKKNAK